MVLKAPMIINIRHIHYEGDRAMNGAQFYRGVVGTDGVGDLYKPYVHDDVIKCLQ